jgi:hypothetical protein
MTQSPPLRVSKLDGGSGSEGSDHADGQKEDEGASSARCSHSQHFAFVALTACLLVFSGVLKVYAKISDDEIFQLAIRATLISAVAIYSRSVLVTIGRTLINGLSKNIDR